MTIRGIKFPFQKGTQSFPEKQTDADVVEDNIRRILETRQGSRPMRPNVGSKVYEFVFENMGPLLNAQMDYEVRRALAEGEPRASVLGVQVGEQERSDGAKNMVVLITWKFNQEVRNTAVTYQSSGGVV